MNFSRIGAGITKWFWVTVKGYLSYILAKFEDLVPLKNPKKEGFMKKSGCHCNRFFVTVSRGVLLVMNRGLAKLSL